MSICQVCGNAISGASLRCRFCGCKQEDEQVERTPKKVFVKKIVNLEQGRPVLEVALGKMQDAIESAKQNNLSILTLIHGYGSSGKGGVIGVECRKSLEYMKSNRQIRDFICGEDFTKKSGPGKALLQRHPQMETDSNLNKGNRGITLVVV